MLYRTLAVVAFAVGLTLTLGVGTAGATSRSSSGSSAAYRQSIRAMPILERPNRVGHFYGNTVRCLNGVNNGRG